jgi:two-component system LytT family sensor kinase
MQFNAKTVLFDSISIVLTKKMLSRYWESYFCFMNNFIQKNHKALIIVGIIAVFVVIILKLFVPVAIPPIILLWLGVAYLISAQFFRKYRIAIFSVYGLALTYFLVFRISPNYMDIHHTNFVNFVLLPIPVFIALWIYEQWRWLKTLKADKAKAELELLKSQINSHFFFNTLNNLYGLVVEKSEKAPEVVLKLSEMMHYIIYEGREYFVPLADEVAYLENYIELHKIRYQKKVDIRFTKQIAEDYSIAPLLFIIYYFT